LDGVKFVIDTGLCKLKVYNPKIGMDALFRSYAGGAMRNAAIGSITETLQESTQTWKISLQQSREIAQDHQPTTTTPK
jgi:hypothetical protein